MVSSCLVATCYVGGLLYDTFVNSCWFQSCCSKDDSSTSRLMVDLEEFQWTLNIGQHPHLPLETLWQLLLSTFLLWICSMNASSFFSLTHSSLHEIIHKVANQIGIISKVFIAMSEIKWRSCTLVPHFLWILKRHLSNNRQYTLFCYLKMSFLSF